MKGFLWPAGLPHVTPIRGEFLCQRTAPLEGAERLLARDGRILLQWFFRNFPRPLNFGGKIFIHRDLSDLVPKAWLAHAGTYSLSVRKSAPIRERIYVGSLEEAQCRWENFELPASASPVSIYVALRTPDADRHEKLLAGYLLQLGARLGRSARVLSWPEFLNRDSYLGAEVFDLGRRILCSDNFLVSHVLSRGGTLVGGDEESEGGSLMPVSPYHSLRVREEVVESRPVLSPSSPEFYRNLASVAGEPRGEEPWPNWFADWSMDHA
jgi:hypothetical protein